MIRKYIGEKKSGGSQRFGGRGEQNFSLKVAMGDSLQKAIFIVLKGSLGPNGER